MDFNRDDTEEGNVDLVYLELPNGRYTEIFIVQASTSVSSNLVGSPTEKGVVRFDNRVRQPKTVHIEGWVTQPNFSSISHLYSAQRTENLEDGLCRFYGRGDVIEDLAINNVTKMEDSNHLNLIKLSISLQEFMRSEE